MCENLKYLKTEGYRKEDSYLGKAGEKYSYEIYTKCGYCTECRNEKANSWVIRNYYESLDQEDICFVTLTYKQNPFMLIKSDGQKFLKRLRRRLSYHENKKIRFFLCGEYGSKEKTHRPHYHIIIYGWKDKNAKCLGYNKKGYKIYYSKLIDEAWGLGITTYQEINKNLPGSQISYTTLYNTAREVESNEYRTSKESLKKLLEKLKAKEQEKTIRRVIIKNIESILKQMEKEKKFFYSMKEYNTWSQGLGFESFYKRFKEPYIYTEYIGTETEVKKIPTPTSWVKRLANPPYNYNSAIAEMLARGELTSKLKIEEIERDNYQKRLTKIRKELKKDEQKDEIL